MTHAGVHHQLSRAVIVAGGPSAAPLRTQAPPVPVIAVNGAVEWSARADFFFTLDPSPANRQRMRQRRGGTVYYAAVPEDYGTPHSPIADLRAPAEPGVIWLRRVAHQARPWDAYDARAFGDWGLRWSAMRGLSTLNTQIHTGNSAYGALGLAFLMGARRVVLAGVDASAAARVEGGRSNDLSHLPALFASAAPQLEAAGVEVVNASLESAVTCFRRMALVDALEWIDG